jgi:hypothetical protein
LNIYLILEEEKVIDFNILWCDLSTAFSLSLKAVCIGNLMLVSTAVPNRVDIPSTGQGTFSMSNLDKASATTFFMPGRY